MISTIVRRIYLEPKYLDQDIMIHLLENIKKQTLNECSKQHGYILSVKSIIEIIHNEETFFTTKFEAEILLPEKGKIMSGDVCMIYKDGIFVNVHKRQKILIPASSIENYTFDEVYGTYNSSNNIIKQGDQINVVITATKYNNKNFSCVGTLA